MLPLDIFPAAPPRLQIYCPSHIHPWHLRSLMYQTRALGSLHIAWSNRSISRNVKRYFQTSDEAKESSHAKEASLHQGEKKKKES